MVDRVLPLRLSRPAALKLIRESCEDSSRIVFTRHALQRMRQRRVTDRQVLECLRRGVMTEGPALDVKGCWACRLERMVAGDDVKVGLAIDPETRVIIVTVM